MHATKDVRPSTAMYVTAVSAVVGALGLALLADLYGYGGLSQALLGAAAAFGGAILGALALHRSQRAAPRKTSGDQPMAALYMPDADELHEMAGIGCWVWYAVSDTMVWNDGMYAIYGFVPGTVVPTRHFILERAAPADRQRVLDTWWKDDSGPGGAMECRIVRPDGEYRHVRYAWRAVDLGTPLARAVGILQDLTALRVAERVRKAEHAQLRGMVESAADYVWEYRTAGGSEIVEKIVLRPLGVDAAAVGDQATAIDLATDHDFAPLVRAITHHRRVRDVAVPVIDTAGEPRWISLSGRPQFDTNGDYYGYRGIGADVTQRMREREAEEDRRRAGAIGRLASGLAHEINNLLQPILIYASFGIDEARHEEKLRQYFGRITRAAERATFVVKNVLAFARHAPPGQEELNVLGVVRETIDLMAGALGPDIRIELVAEASEVVARGERTGLAQIVTNLIANAADAMTSGGTILVRVENVSIAGEVAQTVAVAPGRYCRVTVEDTGPGIPPDLISKVFDPFFTTKPQGKGTGLGLSVVSSLSKSWGGCAQVDSTLGQGARFTVYLPVPETALLAAQ